MRPFASFVEARPAVLFFVSAAFLAGLGLHYVHGVQATGDEPEYLLMAQSLGKEHDLDLADNWSRGDYKEYVPGMSEMPYGTHRKDGRPISTHSPGLPFLLAPVYALGGRDACAIVLTLAAALLGLQVHALALRVTGGDRGAAFLAWAAAVGPPVLYYSFHTYTEIPSALAAAASLNILLASPGPGRAALAALLISLLPWLHVKMIPLAAVLGLFALVRLRGRPRLAFLSVAFVMAASFVTYYEILFGTPTPLGLYGGKVPKSARRAVPEVALFGIFLDRAFGLLPYAPAFIVALGGLPVLFRRTWREGLLYVFYFLAVFVPILTWRSWFAGFCPPARFLVPLVPILGMALALRATGERRGLARFILPLLVIGYLWVPMALWHPAELFIVHAKHDPPRLFSWLLGEDVATRFLPGFLATGAADARPRVVWSLAFVLLLVLDALALRRDSVDRLFRSPLLPLVAAALIVLGIAL